MEDGLYNDNIEPGVFHLDLNINHKASVDKTKNPNAKFNPFYRDMAFRYDCLRTDLIDDDVPDPESTLILLGVLAFRLGKTRAAVQHFQEALESNSSSLNAVLSLSTIWKHMKHDDNELRCRRKFLELMGRSEDNVSESVLNNRLAHSLADQAFAHAYDVGLTGFEQKKCRLRTAIEYYDRAMATGLSSIKHEVQWKWQFMMSTVFLSLDTLMLQTREADSDRLPGYNRAINLLREVAKSNNHFQKSLAWAYLGIFLERQFTFSSTPISIHDCGYTSSQPIDCFSKAIELADKNPSVLNRLAKVFQSMNKHELAIGAAEMSLKLEPNIRINSSALHARAKVYSSLYMKNLHRCKAGVAGMPDRSQLEKAKKDLEELLKVSSSLTTYIEIGQVCYYMGVDALKETFVVNEENVNSALVYFSKALDCEMGNLLPELQLLRGKCLRIKGEERNAIECFKRSIELDKTSSKQSQAFTCLMETLLSWHSKLSDSKQRDDVVHEFDNWLRLARTKYSDEVITVELKSLMHTQTQEVLEFCKETIKLGNTALARLCLSVFPSYEVQKTEAN